MQMRTLGPLQVSLVGLGCNNFGMRIDVQQTRAVVDAAIDAGATFLDTADVYGGTKSEEFLGAALQGRRDKVVLATKFASPVDADETHRGASPRWIRQAVEDSLRRLQTDHIDLYQQHRPDADVPIAETLGALDELVRAGKVLAIGCSNFSAEQLEEADKAAAEVGGARFVSVQNQLSLVHRDAQAEVLPTCERLGLGFLPYFPLASGLLTGKYRRGEAAPEGTRLASMPAERAERVLSERNHDLVERLTAYAGDHGHSILDLAMSWLAAQPTVASVIAGATKPEQVHANAAAVSWRLTPQQLAEIDALL